jgi:hypothetical protein
MYDFLAELFIYAFAAVYVILFCVLAESWIRGAFGRRRAQDTRSPSA